MKEKTQGRAWGEEVRRKCNRPKKKKASSLKGGGKKRKKKKKRGGKKKLEVHKSGGGQWLAIREDEGASQGKEEEWGEGTAQKEISTLQTKKGGGKRKKRWGKGKWDSSSQGGLKGGKRGIGEKGE